jgi:hypothetical protein
LKQEISDRNSASCWVELAGTEDGGSAPARCLLPGAMGGVYAR